MLQKYIQINIKYQKLIILRMQVHQKLVMPGFQKQQDLETASLSSKSSGKQQNQGLAKVLCNKVIKQLNKNEQKYKQIIKQNHHFNFQLYKPRLSALGQIKDKLNTQLLEKQLDRLMQEQCMLDKELSRISFKLQQDEQLKQLETLSHIDHYSFLRSVWNRPSMPSRPDQKIDQISCRVAAIKNNIKIMANKQNTIESAELQKYVYQSKEYNELKLQCEHLQQKIKQTQKLYHNKIIELQNKLYALNNVNLESQKRITEEGQRIRKKQEQILKLMQKCQSAELQVLKKQKQLKKIIKQQNNDNDSNTRLKFVNKVQNFTITINLQTINTQQNIQMTSKSLTEIKQFLQTFATAQKPPILENLIESRASILSKCLGNTSCQYFDKMDVRRSSRIKKTVERELNRADLQLGSQDKRKRFQRTKFFDQ